MNIDLRSARLILLAALAIAVGAASAAQAENEFHAEKAPYTLTGTLTEAFKFTVDGGSAECKGANFPGTVSSATTSEITLSPEFSECTGFGFGVEFDKNGCGYNYFIESFSPDGTGHGYVNISCPAGNELTFTMKVGSTVKCIIHVPPQKMVRSVTFTDTGMSQTRGYKIEHKLTKFKYSVTKGTGLGACAEALSTTNGEMTGAEQMAADEDPGSSHVGIWTE
jgi:hypothetical protein